MKEKWRTVIGILQKNSKNRMLLQNICFIFRIVSYLSQYINGFITCEL